MFVWILRTECHSNRNILESWSGLELVFFETDMIERYWVLCWWLLALLLLKIRDLKKKERNFSWGRFLASKEISPPVVMNSKVKAGGAEAGQPEWTETVTLSGSMAGSNQIGLLARLSDRGPEQVGSGVPATTHPCYLSPVWALGRWRWAARIGLKL